MSFWNTLITLRGGRVWLRPMRAKDADELVAAAEDGELWNVLEDRPATDPTDTEGTP